LVFIAVAILDCRVFIDALVALTVVVQMQRILSVALRCVSGTKARDLTAIGFAESVSGIDRIIVSNQVLMNDVCADQIFVTGAVVVVAVRCKALLVTLPVVKQA
jgi:hypothetical protein